MSTAAPFVDFFSPGITTDQSDLHTRALLLCQGIINAHDANDGFLPYFYVDVRGGKLSYQQSSWALDDSIFRNISAIARVYRMTREQSLLPYLHLMVTNAEHSLAIGGGINAAGDRALMHNLSRGLMALSSMAEIDNFDFWRDRLRHFVTRLDEIYATQGWETGQEYVLATRTWRSHDHSPTSCGRTIGGLVRAYQVTRDPRAIDLAKRLVKVNIQCFDDDGRILETAGPHFHSIADTVQGILAYAQVTNDTNLLAHAERIYRHGLRPRGLHATGWFPEHVHPDGCCSPSLRAGGEICCTANMISSAMLLGRAGFAYAFEDAERYIRNMLFASQLLDLSSVDISDSDEPRWAEFRQRLLGNVAGFPASNSAYDPSSPHLTQLCCAAQAAEALVDAHDATVTSTPDALCVNLLFSIDHADAIVQSSLPAHGSIKITPRRDAIVKIKAPTWSPPDAYVLRKAKKRINSVATMDRHGYLDVRPCRANETIELRLQLPKYKTVEGCALQPDVTFHWRGNSIIACNPQPPLLPFYADRKHLRAARKRTTPTMAS